MMCEINVNINKKISENELYMTNESVIISMTMK